MKVGVNRWTLPGDWDLEKCFRTCHQVGFDSIEINFDESGYLNPKMSDAEAADIRKLADKVGIEISSVSSAVYWGSPFTHNDPGVRQKALDLAEHQIRLTRAMGLDAVLIVPGLVNPETQYDTVYQRASEAMKKIAPVAERHAVTIGVENVWNRFLLSPLEMARFIDEIGSPKVMAYFDVGNVLAFGYPQHWIRILGSRIVRVHVKDFRTNVGTGAGFVNLIQGDVAWGAVSQALREIGYNGYITAEVEGYRGHHELGLRHIADCLKALFPSRP